LGKTESGNSVCNQGFDFIRSLAFNSKNITIAAMNFALAILVYTAMAIILGAGILLLVAGHPWLLIIAGVAFIVAFGKLGCMTH
jgi:hypothetical protein